MDYSKMKVAELKNLAEEKGLRGVSGLKKNELVELLDNIDKMRKTEKTEMTEKSAKSDKSEKIVKSDKIVKSEKVVKSEKSVKSAKKAKTEETDKNENSRERTKASKSSKSIKSEKSGRNKKSVYKSREEKKELSEDKNEEKKNSEESQIDENMITADDTLAQDAGFEEAEDSQIASPVKNINGNEVAEGILEVLADGYGFIRSDNYMPGDKDVYVSPSQIRKFRLRTGDIVKGPIRTKMNPNEKFSALLFIESVNGYSPSEILKRKKFEDMTPVFPNERIHLDYSGAPVSLRIVDLFSPIGKGQRGMIVSPPKAGKTTLLKQIAKRISVANPEMNLIVLLIDERPEEVTDIKESIEGKNAEVIYSTFDELPEHHKRVSEMVIERAKRLVESGNDVVILIDSITRLSRAYNLTVPPSGRTLSGGLDPAALHMPKKFFGAARNMREGGSLTILATALIDTGSRMDDVVFEEFKGTGNMELVLDRNLQEKRVFPAIDISKSGTRKDDLLLTEEEQEVLDLIHARFHNLKVEDVTEDLLKIMSKTENNKQFVAVAKKLFMKYNNSLV